jgi:acyl carrier protein
MEAVLEILSDVLRLPAGELLRRRELADCGWDSMAVMEAIVALEDRFGIELDLRALRHGQRIEDVVQLVREALA